MRGGRRFRTGQATCEMAGIAKPFGPAEDAPNGSAQTVATNTCFTAIPATALHFKGNTMRVLLIEADRTTAQTIELILASEGLNVYTTDQGEEGVDLARLYDYDIILLDLYLPDVSGAAVLHQLRLRKINTPVLVLSDTPDISIKVHCLESGADDYLVKPFHMNELVARIHAIVRRSKGHARSIIRTGAVVLDLDAKTVEVEGTKVHLTGKEYELLEALSLRKGTTLTKEMLLTQLYGGLDEPELKIIDVFICKLRKKLADAGAGRLIDTVWGRGYVVRDPVEAIAEPTPVEEDTTPLSGWNEFRARHYGKAAIL